jgi:hypothetical protein
MMSVGGLSQNEDLDLTLRLGPGPLLQKGEKQIIVDGPIGHQYANLWAADECFSGSQS